MTGALELKGGIYKQILLNLDTEEDENDIGCAGG
jgi:hypothetical protein